MTTYSWPAAVPNPSRRVPIFIGNAKRFTSPLTGGSTTASRPGERRAFTLEWDNVNGAGRAELLAMLERLNLSEHRLLVPQFVHVQRGSLGGTPVVDGVAQTGASIAIRGATASVTGWAKAGDIIRFDANWRRVTADANTDGSGHATVSIMPKIRTSPADGATVYVALADLTGTYMLTGFTQTDDDILASGELSSNVVAEFLEDVFA